MKRFAHVLSSMFVGVFGFRHAALAADTSIAIPMAATAAVEKRVPGSLVLHVTGDGQYFEITVTAEKRVRGCPVNLVHWAAHGPDPSEVLPWQVRSQHFANKRSIPVCGHAVTLEVSLISPKISEDNARFTAGTLVASITARK